ncbi:MAG TPA: phosphate/phosphite/phosphonate ABC transporter substrate-binding protein [Candidatus Deferrimicrobiaceae bacterium]
MGKRTSASRFGSVPVLLACFLACFLALSGCEGKKAVPVDLSKREAVPAADTTDGKAVRIAVGGMITPKEGFAYYREFLDYIGKKLGRPVQYVDTTSYEALNDGLRNATIDAGFVCSGPYVEGKSAFGLELLAMPQAYGVTSYQSYIIVPAKSRAGSLDSLRGKTFAFTDPLSNSGCLVPRYMLSEMGETPSSFFRKTVFLKTHDKSIEAVAEGLVDGAAVDSLIWEYENRHDPRDTSRTRVIVRSEPYGIPPFVVRPGLDPDLKRRIKEICLEAHNDPEGGALLSKMMIDRFVAPDDKAYDSVRQMVAHFAKEGGGKK